MFVQVVDPGSRQSPHTQWAMAGLQVAFGTVTQFDGHCPLVFVHDAPAAPVHSQHTGGGTQVHLPFTRAHCDPGGNVGGHGPVQPITASS